MLVLQLDAKIVLRALFPERKPAGCTMARSTFRGQDRRNLPGLNDN